MSLRLETSWAQLAIIKGFWSNFSKITSFLTNLLRKAIQLEWEEKCESAFEELRQWLNTAPILTLLVEGKNCTIYIDTSKNELECALMQRKQNGSLCLPSAQALWRKLRNSWSELSSCHPCIEKFEFFTYI